MITVVILICTVVISIICFQNKQLFVRLMLHPYSIQSNKEWWRFFTHAFVHADTLHLIMNVFVLYSFGITLENDFENLFTSPKAIINYVLLYTGGILLSSFPSFEKNKNNYSYSSVGASGAVSAVLFSSILIHPNQKLIFAFFPFFPIPAFLFGLAYLIYSWYMAKRGSDNIGHDAHFWGAVFGFLFTILLKPSLFLNFIDQLLSNIS